MGYNIPFELSPEVIQEEQEEKDNVVPFEPKLIIGGKVPPSTGNNWLDDLEVGSIFYVQSKVEPMDFNLGLFKLMSREGHNNKVTVLASPNIKDETGAPMPIYVSSARFVNRYVCYDVLVVERPEDQADMKVEKEEDE